MIKGELHWEQDEGRNTKLDNLDASRTRTYFSPGEGEALLGGHDVLFFTRSKLLLQSVVAKGRL